MSNDNASAPIPPRVQIEDEVSAWLNAESKWPQTRRLAMLKALRLAMPYQSTHTAEIESAIAKTLRKEE